MDFRFPSACFSDLMPAQTYPDGSFEDSWGVRRKGPFGGIPIEHPLAGAISVEDIEKYSWPNPDNIDYDGFVRECEQYSDYAIYGGAWSPFFYVACELMGMDNLFVNMVEAPEVVHALLDKTCGFYLEVSRRMFEKARNKMDIFFMGEDFGTQNGLIMSRDMWRIFIAPRLKSLFEQAKLYGYKVMLHSCGSVRDLIPDLIEMGLDGLDPIQVRARGMNIEELKQEYGSVLTFRGSIDTQQTLPYGTPEDVKREVIDRICKIAPGGGFILNSSQNLLPEIPLENIITMYRTAYEYGHYDSLGQRKTA
ncbi:MAG: hypothetical protein HPY71_09395 [Firmicutes bacterium]|nr:hypothetical protein [Bacillota bacterium]